MGLNPFNPTLNFSQIAAAYQFVMFDQIWHFYLRKSRKFLIKFQKLFYPFNNSPFNPAKFPIPHSQKPIPPPPIPISKTSPFIFLDIHIHTHTHTGSHNKAFKTKHDNGCLKTILCRPQGTFTSIINNSIKHRKYFVMVTIHK